MISEEEFASQKAAARIDQESSEDELVFQLENDQQQQQLSHSLPSRLEKEHKEPTATPAHSGRRNRQKQRSGKDNRRARFYPIIPKDSDDQRVSDAIQILGSYDLTSDIIRCSIVSCVYIDAQHIHNHVSIFHCSV